jgi:YD repeat-containing protein
MKKLLFGVFTMLFSTVMYGQDLPKIVPPSPTVYELGKYGEIHTGYFTGTIQPNIPLMSYKTNNLNMPISLNYRSNGIKVDQLTSNVGLGWSLNIGGVISRVVKGQPDEERNILLPYNVAKGNTLSSEAIDYYFSMVKDGEQYDSEIDIFNFNFLGRSGRFVLDKNNNPVLLSPIGIQIVPSANFNEFKVIDEHGVHYYFNEIETSKFRSHGNGHDIWSDINKTAWYLTKIAHPNKDEIYLHYKRINYTYDLGKSQSYTVTLPQLGCINIGYSSAKSIPITNRGEYNTVFLDKITSNNESYGKIKLNYLGQHDTQVNYSIKQIIYYDKNDSIIKNIELEYLITQNHRTFLKSVDLKKLGKKYKFEYINPTLFPERLSYSQDHWGYYNGKYNASFFPNPSITRSVTIEALKNHNIGANKEPDANYAQYGLLKKVIYPTKGFTSFKYEGNSYYGIQTTNPIEVNSRLDINTSSNEDSKTVKQKLLDIKVNQNLYLNNKSIQYKTDSPYCFGEIFHNTKAHIRILNLTTNKYVVIQNQTVSGNHNIGTTLSFSPKQMYPRAFVNLKANNTYKISLSVTASCLKSHLFYKYLKGESKQTFTNIPTGGLRIKKIITNNNVDPQNIKRIYYGTKDNLYNSSAIKGILPKYDKLHINRTPCPGDGYNDVPNDYKDIIKYVISSSSIKNLFYSDDVSNTSYKNVTISYGGDEFENGGDEFEYLTSPGSFGILVYGNHIEGSGRNNINWDNGLLKKQVTFKKKGNEFVDLLIKENSYIKDQRINNIIYGFTIRKKFNLLTYHPSPSLLNIENLDIMKNYFHTNWSYLTTTILTQYDNNGLNPIKTTTNYFYDNINHLQQTRIEKANSKGEVLTSVTKYAHDVDDLRLISENRIAEPIEMKTFKGDDQISHQKTIYDNNHNNNNQLYLPKTIQTSKGTAPLEDRIIYHRYDDKGNPVEVSKKDGTHVVYIWGYNHSQPIAKIENASYFDVQNQVSNLQTLSNNDNDRTIDTKNSLGNVIAYNGKEGKLREALQGLRNALPNAQVTTYTYDPLIGVTSMTDPGGETIYYTYDTFNRLEFVKDADGNILSNNQYNYKN